MVKIKPTTEEYEAQLAEAGIIIAAFMNFFPAAECREQQEVVDAAIKFIEDTNEMLK